MNPQGQRRRQHHSERYPVTTERIFVEDELDRGVSLLVYGLNVYLVSIVYVDDGKR